MNQLNIFKSSILIIIIGVLLFGCKTEDSCSICPIDFFPTPTSYKFSRNGLSSVSYDGQTTRLNQLADIKSKLTEGDNGNVVSAQVLKDMFANVNGNGNGHFSDTVSTSKQLKNKTFSLDQAYFEALFDSVEVASRAGANNDTAASGKAGIAYRSGGKTILVDQNGREFTQLIEKGIMGATFYNQIVNTYLTDDRIGMQVNNTDLVSDKNYTLMEHHMDEAFGYLGAPFDFASNYKGTGSVQYWANYSNIADAHITMNNRIMNAFKRARAAIVANNFNLKDEEVNTIYSELEVLIAATAIHYANEAKSATIDGDRLHVLSECYAFTRAFRYSNANKRLLSQTEVDDLLNNKIGNNLWATTETNLNLLIYKLSSTYGLEGVKNQL